MNEDDEWDKMAFGGTFVVFLDSLGGFSNPQVADP